MSNTKVFASEANDQLTPAPTPLNGTNCFPSHGNFYRRSPYQPGSSYGENITWPVKAMSQYAPGSPGMSRVDELSFNLAAVADAFSWGAAAILGDQISDSDYKGTSITGLLKTLTEAVNNILGRIGALDDRSREDYNVYDSVTFVGGATEYEYTTAHAYARAPGIQATSSTDPTTLDVGNVSAHSFVQNADGTWTGTIEIENPDMAGIITPTVSLDIKGTVAADEDIDP
jgi:hypothetical protein